MSEAVASIGSYLSFSASVPSSTSTKGGFQGLVWEDLDEAVDLGTTGSEAEVLKFATIKGTGATSKRMGATDPGQQTTKIVFDSTSAAQAILIAAKESKSAISVRERLSTGDTFFWIAYVAQAKTQPETGGVVMLSVVLEATTLNVEEGRITTLALASSASVTHTYETSDGTPISVDYPDGSSATMLSGVSSTKTISGSTAGDVVLTVASGARLTSILQSVGVWNYTPGDLPSGLESLTVTSTTATISGDVAELPATLTHLNVAGVNTLSGDVGDLPRGLTYCRFSGSSTINGDIAGLPSTLETVIFAASAMAVSGDIADLPSGLEYVYFAGVNTVSGAVDDLPATVTYLFLSGTNTVTASTPTWPSSMRHVTIHGSAKTEGFVDEILSSLADDATTWTSPATVSLAGTNAAPSAGASTDVSTLTGRGVTVTTN